MERNQVRLLGIVAGFAAAASAIVIYLIATGPGRMDVVTIENFELAEELWADAKVSSYRIRVQVRGRQPAIYEVEVRDNDVTQATRNGDPLRQARTLDTWTVPGMFYTLSLDVDHQERTADGSAEPGEPNVRVRAAFDEQFGFPRRYHRTQFVERGENPATAWEVLEFENLTDG